MPATLSAPRLYRSPELRLLEQAARPAPLMERAGAAAAALAQQLVSPAGGQVLILVGPGNNGGDALVAARLLRERFFAITVIFPGAADELPADAAAAYRRLLAAGGSCQTELTDACGSYALIIDGLFGIGLSRPLAAPYADLIAAANAIANRDACPLLALDCPSGLNADTGVAGPLCIRASHTLTFLTDKPGLHTADGPDYCGQLACADLAVDASALLAHTTNAGHLLTAATLGSCLAPRRHNSHKGSHGSAGILGGAAGMLGAALLAGRAALKLGAGRVFVGLRDERAPAVDPLRPELMLRDAAGLLATPLEALAVGPGFGGYGTAPNASLANETAQAEALLSRCLDFVGPLVIDADALNLISRSLDLQQRLRTRVSPTLLTPHPAEAARLLACDTASVQADRVAAACQLATSFNAHVALKGCGTVIAGSDGSWAINPTGNAGLASAGTGDVLTGMTVALLAQGAAPATALATAVYLHGAAADLLVTLGDGPLGLAADELVDAARRLLNQAIRQQAGR